MSDVQDVTADTAPVVDAVPQPAPEQSVEAPASDAPPPAQEGNGQTQGADDGIVEATADEARASNYVPYTRFREVNGKRRELESEVQRLRQEREDWLARSQTIDRFRDERHRPPTPEGDPWGDEDIDPVAAARMATREELDRFRTEQATRDKAADIRASIAREVTAAGFRNPDKALAMVERIVIADVKHGDPNPDVEAIARDLRQQEVELERSIAADYQGRKNSAAAQAARQNPPAPPIVPPPPERKLEGVSSRSAYQRVMDRLRGG